jgi:hypothetical protein
MPGTSPVGQVAAKGQPCAARGEQSARSQAGATRGLRGRPRRGWRAHVDTAALAGRAERRGDAARRGRQVLDARDPLGTRCRYLEQHLRKHARHKHMLLLLNKCDLVRPGSAPATDAPSRGLAAAGP